MTHIGSPIVTEIKEEGLQLRRSMARSTRSSLRRQSQLSKELEIELDLVLYYEVGVFLRNEITWKISHNLEKEDFDGT
jgi:hypothetical protein